MNIKDNNKIRNLFAGVNTKVCDYKGKYIDCINFDNAATTPPFILELKYIEDMCEYYASIGRGTGQKAELSTKMYQESKKYLLNFFNIKDKDKYMVIYVKNTTEGINKLSKILKRKKDEIVLLSRMEHHSNDLPWRKTGKVDYIEVDKDGRLKIDEIETLLKKHKGKVKYVSLTGASNVTGYVNDINKIAKIVHKYNAKIIVDGAQIVSHRKVIIQKKYDDEQIDFLVFSAHKVYAPFGTGVIIGLKEELNKVESDYYGGGTVELVLDNHDFSLSGYERHEAGTQNLMGAMSLIKSMDILEYIGYDFIKNHESILLKRALDGLKSIPRVILYGDCDKIDDRLGILTFNIDGIYHRDVSEYLSKVYGLQVRHGWFCAHPYCRRLMNISESKASEYLYDKNKKMYGMIRLSFAPYNTEEEIDVFLNAVEDISKNNFSLYVYK
ncbi:aminotransferase class V-fold PLP-dependent enzyme [Clostridium sp. BJN0001]|uniref:aminotransferase class V-fold PLP-dependent enzyme n=1 Tax=Clostridium sp. BJN0001 TaxID=2930219 RepID=UPI001FD4E753|nr:aminotransferase class V-fold PLP-dependent enzyme [Clostridium sp. BJN0001]